MFVHLVKVVVRVRKYRQGIKYGIHISPNACGYGLHIPHIVGGVIINASRVGNYCIFNTGVVIGNKDCQENRPTIGDNCEFAIGSKVYGKITIGDNVIVAPNSVVYKDVESGMVLSGVPAQVIGRNKKTV